MSKGKKYSSFLKEQKTFDNWRNYLNENREVLNEARVPVYAHVRRVTGQPITMGNGYTLDPGDYFILEDPKTTWPAPEGSRSLRYLPKSVVLPLVQSGESLKVDALRDSASGGEGMTAKEEDILSSSTEAS